MKKISLLILIMTTSTASSFNMNIGGLRERGNSNEQFNKAMSDRLAMLKFEAPSDNEAKINQELVKGVSAGAGLKAVSDIQGTYKKGLESVDKIKQSGENIAGAYRGLVTAGQELGQKTSRTVTAGVRALKTKALPPAEISATTTTKPSAPSAPSAKAVAKPQADLDDVSRTNLSQAPQASILPDLPGMTQTPEEAKTAFGGASSIPSQVDTDASHLTQLADFRQPGASLIAQVTGGGRSRAVGGIGDTVTSRVNPMNVSNSLTGNTANAQLDNLTQGLKNGAGRTAGAIRNATGDLADTSTNIHASVQTALESFKSQVGGALGDIQKQVSGVAGQISDVGKGVGAVGSDVASVAGKVTTAVSSGLETAGVVADALGPVGDLIGLGMSIFGGVEEKHEHAKEVQASQKAQQAVSQPVKSVTTQATGLSLDTSKPAQAMAQSHY